MILGITTEQHSTTAFLWHMEFYDRVRFFFEPPRYVMRRSTTIYPLYAFSLIPAAHPQWTPGTLADLGTRRFGSSLDNYVCSKINQVLTINY